jgi:hypothetical protein
VQGGYQAASQSATDTVTKAVNFSSENAVSSWQGYQETAAKA